MNAERYLGQLSEMLQPINRHREKLLEMQANIYGVKGITYDKDTVQTSVSGDRMAEGLSEYIEYCAMVGTELETYAQLERRILWQIGELHDERLQRILIRRYIQFVPMTEIAAELGLSTKRLRNLHGQACRLFEAIHEFT